MVLTGKLPLIVILGPTASGKTGLAIELAHTLNGEIINADSRQVYAGLGIASAGPSEDERARVPHHLVQARHVDRLGRHVDDVEHDPALGVG